MEELESLLGELQGIVDQSHITASGEMIPVSEMTDAHLKNSLAYGQKHRDQAYWDNAVPKFIREIEKRKKS